MLKSITIKKLNSRVVLIQSIFNCKYDFYCLQISLKKCTFVLYLKKCIDYAEDEDAFQCKEAF